MSLESFAVAEREEKLQVAAVSSDLSPLAGLNVMVVAAHPDDEVLFAGGQLGKACKLTIVHVTDGAPSTAIARARGFRTRRAYSRARRKELRAALRAGEVEAQCICLGYRDGRSCLSIVSGVRRLSDLIDRIRPDLVLTHAYDGGHYDHDTTAVLVQLAVRRAVHTPASWEMAGYYEEGGRTHFYRFARVDQLPGVIVQLTPAEQGRKRLMLDCFASQRHLTDQFPVEIEVLRPAPAHDFRYPPLVGKLGYEANEAGADSSSWRRVVLLSEHVLQGSKSSWLPLIASVALMYAMLVSHRMRLRHPRVARPFELLVITVCCANDGRSKRHSDLR